MNSSRWSDIEVFNKKGRNNLRAPSVTFTVRGVIVFNQGFMKRAEVFLHGMTHVILSFSKNNNAIIFNFTNVKTEIGCIKLNYDSNINFSAKSFFNYYGIPLKKLMKYIPVLEEIPSLGGEVWVVYL